MFIGKASGVALLPDTSLELVAAGAALRRRVAPGSLVGHIPSDLTLHPPRGHVRAVRGGHGVREVVRTCVKEERESKSESSVATGVERAAAVAALTRSRLQSSALEFGRHSAPLLQCPCRGGHPRGHRHGVLGRAQQIPVSCAALAHFRAARADGRPRLRPRRACSPCSCKLLGALAMLLVAVGLHDDCVCTYAAQESWCMRISTLYCARMHELSTPSPVIPTGRREPEPRARATSCNLITRSDFASASKYSADCEVYLDCL
jgi:hypothetical protein